jgi:hypothetical protein
VALPTDYSPCDPDTQVFFKPVQNKLHFAATGKRAPELIAKGADSSQYNMGLRSLKGGWCARVRKGDLTVAKNYLRGEEIGDLSRIMVMLLDFAKDQARRRKQIFLETWRARLDDFLRLNERAILPDAGRVSRERADALPQQEYGNFGARRQSEFESAGELEAFKQIEDQIKKLPKTKKSKRAQP